MEEIGYHAFKGCAKITNIVIPQSVLTIEDYIFKDCTMLNMIFCESVDKPVGWVDGWKNYCNAQVYWGNDWSFVNGIPQIKEN